MKVSYNWLKWYIPNVVDPEKLRDVFTYHLTEVEGVEKLPDGDTIFDLNILPNRAHDLLSHRGVARELSGQLGISFTDSTKTYEDIMAKRSISSTSLRVDIQTENCRRYSARIIRNIKVGPSPEWVGKHLESIGQRSINNIVDATNLVMYNCGQPTHAFDLSGITNQELRITNAEEEIELPVVGRDGIIAKLVSSDTVITSGEKTLGLAGVKGGRDSGITDITTDIVLEVANFDPTAVRKTARRLGLLSDSAKRFENDLSPELCDFAMLELSALISEMCPDASFEEIIDVYPTRDEWKKEKKISFSSDMISKKLGVSLSSLDIETILKNYHFVYSKIGDSFEITVPSLRLDLVSVEDVVEEIGRIYGYDKVIPVLPKLNFALKQNDTHLKILSTREQLVHEGYSEVLTYSFTNKGEVEILASASDKNFLRTNLSDGLKKAYEMNKLNAPLLGVNEIKIFEIGTVFANEKEEIHIALANKKEIKEMKLEEFSTKYQVSSMGNQKIPNTKYQIQNTSFRMWSPYPFITRDIAVWVPSEIKSDNVYQIIKENSGELLITDPKLIDTFSKDEKTSYAFRIVFQSNEKTLTDDEIGVIMSAIGTKISEKGWVVR